MKDGLLEKIHSVGHWRLVLRPLVPLPEKLTYRECGDVVERARVSIRGWDFPHLSRRQDDQGGSGREDGFVYNWTDWRAAQEFWRMYQSGQFLFYSAVHDDTEFWNGKNAGEWLDVVDAIYTVTEFVEFAQRLTDGGPYRDGYALDLKLQNTQDRKLAAGRGRMPFFDDQKASGSTISIERRVDPEDATKGAMETSLGILLELFDAFGWNPDPNQIRADQEGFYRRDFR